MLWEQTGYIFVQFDDWQHIEKKTDHCTHCAQKTQQIQIVMVYHGIAFRRHVSMGFFKICWVLSFAFKGSRLLGVCSIQIQARGLTCVYFLDRGLKTLQKQVQFFYYTCTCIVHAASVLYNGCPRKKDSLKILWDQDIMSKHGCSIQKYASHI